MINKILLTIILLSTFVFDQLGYRYIPDYEGSGTGVILAFVAICSGIFLALFFYRDLTAKQPELPKPKKKVKEDREDWDD